MKSVRAILLALGLAVMSQAAGPALPEVPASFPSIRDWHTLQITLQRGACFGPCPIYEVQISGDGTVRYNGRHFVAVTGSRESHISIQYVRVLYEAFAKADFFHTLDSYSAPVTDLPTYALTIAFDGKQKRVVDYGGEMSNMPHEITALENQVDQGAGTAQWVKGPPR